MKINFNKILFVVFMWIVFAILLLTTFGCGSERHLKRMEHHRIKAVEKGATIHRDTDTIFKHDTTTVTYTRNDTTFVEKTITETITIQGQAHYITKWDRKKQYKLQEQVNRLSAKNERLQARLDKRMDVAEQKTKRVVVRAKKRSVIPWILLGSVLTLLLIAILIILLPKSILTKIISL